MTGIGHRVTSVGKNTQMHTCKVGIAGAATALLIVLMAGCGQEVVNIPTVVSTTPASGATSVVINTTITATFSMAMNPATISTSTFTVTGPGGAAIPGTVTYSGTTATFTPSAVLAYSSLYTATITTGAKDVGGVPLCPNYAWSFTTITPPPTATAVVPANAATNVPIGQVLSATFSEAMTPATINATTFTLTGPGGVAVPGAVAYSGTVATFTPTANLAYSTVYTATITTGAASLAGTPLAANYVWTFTTITPPPMVAAVVPVNGATNVPVGQVLSATFNEAMLPATINTTTFTVTGPGGVAVPGTVTYSGVVARFTPAANLAYSTLYTATITTGAQDLAGTGLSSKYTWTFTAITPPPAVTATVPLNAATSVPIGQALSATFNEAMTPAALNTSTFIVTGPGGTAVPGAVTYSGVAATFTPTANLAYSTLYTATITTGAASLAGTPLAANYAWTFTTITPPPTVTATVPFNAATGVPVGQALTATFNEAMTCGTLTSTTFTVTGPGATAVAGTVGCTGSVATFTPSASLSYSTLYTATITTGAASLAGTPLAASYVWTFTTITPPPMVTAVVPVNGATNVPIGQELSATFSEAMTPATINAATFTVTGPGGVSVPGAVAYSGLIARFIPTANLAYSTVYTATINTGAASLAGTPLAASYAWTFTTISPTPAVVSTVPGNGATGVLVHQVLSATFNEAMNCATLTSPATTLTVTGPGTTPVVGTVGCTGSVATFTPGAALAFNTLYTATINTGAKDQTGNALASNFVWSFLTVPAPTPPTVISTVPINLATGVPINQALTATLSVAMNAATINATTFTLSAPGGATVTGVVTYVASGSVATFTPAASLAPSTVYTATITTGAMDLEGTALASNYVWTFTTAAAPDITPPTVIATIPANLATNVPFNQVISATFSKAMNPATISATTFTLTGPGATAVSGLVAYAAIGNTLTFIPAANLAPSTLFTATITTGAQDLAGNALASNYVWTFTTGAAPDITPPQVVSTIPANSATNVLLNQTVSATFTKAMNPLTITTATFQLTGPGSAGVTGTVSYDAINFIATFTPTSPLTGSTIYTATITTGATDLAGNPLAGNDVWTFTTITPPMVTAVVPLNGATNAPIGQVLSATFSEAMNPATISAATFTLSATGGAGVAGIVTYSGQTAAFAPTVPLAYSTQYTATITTGTASLAGTPLAANYVWTFTTITPPPMVTAVVPVNGAINVPIGQVLSATFNEAINCATLTSTTFTVTGPGATAVTGTAGCTGSVATFTPTANLAYSTLYTATITTGAQDLADQPLASNYAWTFTTITPAPTVTAVVPVNATTNVPIGQVLSATFSEAMLPGSLDAATFTVTGPGGVSVPGAVAYSGLVARFTPTANLDYSTSYTATITTGAEDLAGTPLATSYAWSFTTISPTPAVISTVPVNGATGVPLSQILSATFNEAMKCATLTSTTFTVTGPGTTAVAGTVGCTGSVATFTPGAALVVNTLYTATITTGAQDLASTPMASNYVWSFLTVPAPTPPTVISTVPINLATGVPINQALTATFSVAMNAATIDTTTFTLSGPGGATVTGVVTYIASGSIATFTPDASLASSTVYTATITTGAMNLQGTALASNYAWTFTTAAAPIVTPPVVVSTVPANLAANVPFNQVISATFSKAMDPATISSATFTLTGPGSTNVTGLVAYAAIGNTLTFIPAANLAPSTLFTATITTGAQDLAGDALASNYVWTFTTGAAPDITPPQVVSTVPANSATNIPLNQTVSATFTEAMNPLTITTATFTLTGPGGTAIAGTVSYDAINFIATFTPTAALTNSTTYTATVTAGATDLAGNPLGNTGAPNPWTFTTGAAAVPPPVVLGSTITLFGGFSGVYGITNTGTDTVIDGDIGTTGASSLMTGFHDTSVLVGGVYECTYTETTSNIGQVNGTIDTAAPSPTVGCPNEGTTATAAIATEAELEAQAAYNTLKNLPAGTTLSTNELGNRTLAPGTYTSTSFYDITTGPLTLDAQGDPNAFWVFQMGTYLTVGTPSAPESVLLMNGAKASNVFWQVGSAATINGVMGGGTMVGTIISQAGISVSTAGVAAVTTINGRLLALNAAITIVNTVITVPAP